MFSLRGKKIAIYGYNPLFERHDRLVKHLKDAGLNIDAIIDQKATSLPVIALTYNEFLQNTAGSEADYVVILDCNSANTHVLIAEKLYSRGFENIIFVPFDEKYSRGPAQLMRRYFNQMIYGSVTGDEKLPSYRELISGGEQQIIRDYGEYISFWAPVDKLCLANIPCAGDAGDTYQTAQFNAVLVTDYTTYLKLYDYFFNNGDYPLEYIASKLAGRDERAFLEDRKQLFLKLNYQLKYDPDFFIDSPIFVVFNRVRRLFIVLDGLHRVTFLLKNGYQQVPVICNRKNAAYYFGE